MSLNPRLVKESFAVVEPVADKAAAYFYGRLFAENPHLRTMFPPAMDVQRDRLFGALTRIVWSLDSPDSLASFLGQLGRDHRKYGVVAEHYTAIGNALLATVRRFAAEIWNTEIEAAWTAAYTAAANLMIESAESDAGVSPAWWLAEVVDHELRTPDIAVITLRLDRDLPYLPGQYVSVQTARWPRVWRTFSIANAPRDDNTVRLHVRAISGGWVSTTLVQRTRIGDTLMVGPPIGTMVPTDSGRDILCVAGGTGLAPIKAILEHVIGSGRRPNIHLLHGARTTEELYDLADLLRMASAFPRLRVLPVVSGQPGYDGMRGQVAEVMERFHSWAGHEAYVCGPIAMVNETVHRLQRGGVPLADIRRDIVQGEP
ncbi:FAD-binding oxidoreductase [Streptosporangium sp. NBC_01755]|uniref:globin domain-containing protein n=1 Tax=unclassified Streptosporangium TaxID=2632669 RepID=UPI002DDBF400|nr:MULTISPECIES: globin domain-containing protein [unclassified Streptosporangium]WSA28924.1 FAD-binding oxidoreductase [Streptosporangium sp. NBC_01810]WSC99629.1 FAD-binding oxidoreductase [Streptosporangium sp. NBC_01755]